MTQNAMDGPTLVVLLPGLSGPQRSILEKACCVPTEYTPVHCTIPDTWRVGVPEGEKVHCLRKPRLITSSKVTDSGNREKGLGSDAPSALFDSRLQMLLSVSQRGTVRTASGWNLAVDRLISHSCKTQVLVPRTLESFFGTSPTGVMSGTWILLMGPRPLPRSCIEPSSPEVSIIGRLKGPIFIPGVSLLSCDWICTG